MHLGIITFGSVWRRRFGCDADDPNRFRRAAYFNTTGVRVNGRIMRHRKIAGHVRFNGIGGFNPYYIERMIGSVFECEAPCIWNGQNKIFCSRRLSRPERPDYFLLAVRSAEFGWISVGTNDWKSADAWLISFSEWRDQQELLVLSPPDGWVRTGLGRVVLSSDATRPWSAGLTLRGDDGEVL